MGVNTSLSLDKKLGDCLIAAAVVFSGGALYLRSEHQATKRFDAAEKLAEKREKAATQHIDDVKDATTQRSEEERENVGTQHIGDVKDALMIQRIDDLKDAATQRFDAAENLAATRHDAVTQRLIAAENLATTRHDADGKLADVRADAVKQRIDDLKDSLVPGAR
jgi:hypothetical protein